MRMITRVPLIATIPTSLLIALAIACGGANRTATTAADTPTWTTKPLGTVSQGADSLVSPALAIDADGQPAVAYAAQGSLEVRKWNGDAWVRLGAAVNANGGPAKLPALALDATGLVIAWEDSSAAAHVVRASRFDGTSWVPLGTQVNPDGTSARRPRLAVGAQGIVVAYVGANPSTQAVVTRWTGSGWQDWPSTPSLDATSVELSLLRDGSPAIAWIRSSTATGSVEWDVAIRYWSPSSSAWMTLPQTVFQYSPEASLATTEDGTLFLATDSVAGLQPVRSAPANGSDWQVVAPPEGAMSAAGPLAPLPGAGIALGFVVEPLDARIARYTGSSWDVIARVAATQFSFAGAADGTLYVAWLAETGQGTTAPIQVASFHTP